MSSGVHRVERMKQCDDISAVSRELEIDRRLLYRRRDQLDPPEKSEWPPPQNSRESTLRKESYNSSECWPRNSGTRFFQRPCKKLGRDGSRGATLARRHLAPNPGSDVLCKAGLSIERMCQLDNRNG